MSRHLPLRALRRPAAGLAASLLVLSLAACGGEEESAADQPASASEESPSEAPSEESEAPEESDAAATGDGSLPEWAAPSTAEGEKISTLELGDITVDVFQVGTAEATKTGQFVDPDTNKPLIAEGDEIVFVNYVATNDGDPVDLGSSLISIDARYEDWPYLQGMDGIVDSELFEEQGVHSGGVAPGAYQDPSVYTFDAGQSFAWGENFAYQSGSPIVFDATLTPVDAEGELLHDDRVEAEGTGTIS